MGLEVVCGGGGVLYVAPLDQYKTLWYLQMHITK